jgi:hypothetical protein
VCVCVCACTYHCITRAIGHRKFKTNVIELIHQLPPHQVKPPHIPIVHKQIPPTTKRMAETLGYYRAGTGCADVGKKLCVCVCVCVY